MRPLPLLAAFAILVVLALRRRTLGRVTGAVGALVAALLAVGFLIGGFRAKRSYSQ
jgi:formate hydrogenlyase subunit 3/multisubunit Na+/H+ antiporter MnhD subunit